MFTAEEARKAVAEYQRKEKEAIETLARTAMGKIEIQINTLSRCGLNSVTYHDKVKLFGRQEVEETVTHWLAQAGYQVEINHEIYRVHW